MLLRRLPRRIGEGVEGDVMTITVNLKHLLVCSIDHESYRRTWCSHAC